MTPTPTSPTICGPPELVPNGADHLDASGRGRQVDGNCATSDDGVRELRHRAEIPMLLACGAVTACGVGVALLLAVRGIAVPAWALLSVAGLTVPLLTAAVVIRWTYWRSVANAVEVTAEQLPEVHTLFTDLVGAMAVTPPPRLYVTNGNGALNAFAAKCRVRRSYVVIASDLVDIGYEHGDWPTLKFVLAHELAHIRCGHVALWRSAIAPLPRLVWLDRSRVRAQEYTADRCAARYAPEGAHGLLVLYAGKRLYRHIDLDTYRKSVRAHGDGVWLRLANLLSTHPVGFRRLEALADMSERGWDVHGRML
jgi:Zn-dependent protease with chaperone function